MRTGRGSNSRFLFRSDTNGTINLQTDCKLFSTVSMCAYAEGSVHIVREPHKRKLEPLKWIRACSQPFRVAGSERMLKYELVTCKFELQSDYKATTKPTLQTVFKRVKQTECCSFSAYGKLWVTIGNRETFSRKTFLAKEPNLPSKERSLQTVA